MKDLICEEKIVHEDTVKKIKNKILDDDTVYDLAEFFKIFGDSTRAKILSVLEVSSLCVCDICASLNMSISAISHQLRILRSAKLVKAKRKGKEVIYSFDDEHVSMIFECALKHLKENK